LGLNDAPKVMRKTINSKEFPYKQALVLLGYTLGKQELLFIFS